MKIINSNTKSLKFEKDLIITVLSNLTFPTSLLVTGRQFTQKCLANQLSNLYTSCKIAENGEVVKVTKKWSKINTNYKKCSKTTGRLVCINKFAKKSWHRSLEKNRQLSKVFWYLTDQCLNVSSKFYILKVHLTQLARTGITKPLASTSIKMV